jgi:hypothetical protein
MDYISNVRAVMSVRTLNPKTFPQNLANPKYAERVIYSSIAGKTVDQQTGM